MTPSDYGLITGGHLTGLRGVRTGAHRGVKTGGIAALFKPASPHDSADLQLWQNLAEVSGGEQGT